MSIVKYFRSAVKPSGRQATWSPFDFIEAWASLVADAKAGYTGDLYEYENDLGVRDLLELAVGDVQLESLQEWRPWRRMIDDLDSQMRQLLSQGPEVRPGERWWRARLPPHAGDELKEDAKRLYGVDLGAP